MISRKGKDLGWETGIPPGTRLEEDREQSVLHGLFWKRLPSRRAARNLPAWISISPEAACTSARGRALPPRVSRGSAQEPGFGGGSAQGGADPLPAGSRLFLLGLARQPPPPGAPGPVRARMPERPEAEDRTGPASASPAARGHARSRKRGKVCRLPGHIQAGLCGFTGGAPIPSTAYF